MSTPAYVFRKEGDTDNPALARLYGIGITRGLDVMFRQNPAQLLTILCEGARSDDDTHCGGITLVTYRGFVIPEFENGVRQWMYHKGKTTAVPVYKTVTANNSTNTLTSSAHGLVNSPTTAETYKIIAEGPLVSAPAVPAGLIDEQQAYYVVGATTNTFQLSLSVGGAAVDFTDNGSGTLRVYRANTAFDDPEQGRPHFFPDLDFTLSGIAYVELQVPTRFAEDFNPDDMRYIVRGKMLRTFTVGGDDIITLDSVASAVDSPNPALEMLDFYINDASVGTSFVLHGVSIPRYRGTAWGNFKTRCDTLIDWTEGGDVGGPFNVLANVGNYWTINTTTGALSTTYEGENKCAYGRALPSTDQNFAIEAVPVTGSLRLGFNTNNTDGYPLTARCIQLKSDGKIHTDTAGVLVEIGTWAVGDRIKVASENRVLKVYQNDVPIAIAAYILPSSTLYAYVHGVADSLAQVSATNFTPRTAEDGVRQVKRFTSNIVFPQPMPVLEAGDVALRHAPGVEIQDVNGGIKPLTDMTRTHAHTFRYDVSFAQISNLLEKGVEMYRIPPEDRTNFYRATIRDTDDANLKIAPLFEDRPELRALPNVGLVDSTLLNLGVMNQSEGSRILKAQARIRSDFPIFGSITSMFDSYVASIGDYTYLADDVPGYTVASPVLFIVNEESSSLNDVPTRNFRLQVTTKDYYSDTDHGPAVPVIPDLSTDFLRPAPLVSSLTLSQSTETLSGLLVFSLVGDVVFNQFVGQSAKIWRRKPVTTQKVVSYDAVTDFFTNTSHGFVNGDELNFQRYLGVNLPTTGDFEVAGTPYFVINKTLDTFQISTALAGSVFTLPSNFSAYCHKVGSWEQTGITITPDASNISSFEIAPAQPGTHHVKAVTQNRVGTSLPFEAHAAVSLIVEQSAEVPSAPSRLRAIGDNVNVSWSFAPSRSEFVTSYQVTDEYERIVRNNITDLTWVETITGVAMTRRVYAVSNLGIRSTAYAQFTFISPPIVRFANITGGIVNDSGVFIKTASTVWSNCGATLSYLILSDAVESSLTYAVDTVNQGKVFGITRQPFPDSYDDLLFGISFSTTGQAQAMYHDGTTLQTVNVGAYAVGEKWEFRITPIGSVRDESLIELYKLTESTRGFFTETLMYTYPSTATLARLFPAYCGIALLTTGDQFAPHFEMSGILVPTEGDIPIMQNVNGLTYDTATGHVTTTASGGCSTVQTIDASQDGIFTFFQSTLGHYYVGLNPTDADDLLSSIPYAVSFNASYQVQIYSFGTLVTTLSNTSSSSTEWSLSRENGIMRLRKNGRLVHSYSGSATYAAQALRLDIVSTASGGVIQSVKLRKAQPTINVTGTANRVPVYASLINPVVGQNRADSVPRFLITAPTAGQAMVLDEDGNLINANVSGDLATDALFDAKGDLIVGTGSNAATRLPVGSNDFFLTPDSSLSTGLKWIAASYVKTALSLVKADVGLGGVDNVQQLPLSYLDTDTALAANSDVKVASQKAGKAYTDAGIATRMPLSYLDTDTALAANSDTKVASQKAGKAYADAGIATRMPLSYLDTDVTLAANSDTKVASQKAAKAYMDALAQGFTVKQPVRLATVGNITLSGEQTVDGSVTSASRVLVKDQSTGSQNGIYVSSSGAWTRATDADVSAEVKGGMYVYVNEGSTNGDSGWALTTNDTITIGSTALVFAQFTGAGQINPGAALTKNGNTLDVAVDNSTIEISADALKVKDGGISFAKLVSITGAALLGRTSGTGVIAAMALGAALFLTSDVLGVRDASTSVYGATKLTYAAVTAADPIAVGANDPAWRDLGQPIYLEEHGYNDAGLGAAISAASTNRSRIIITKDLTVTTSRSIPTTCMLDVQNEALISFSGAITVTIGKFRDPGNVRVFSGVDADTHVLFSAGAVPNDTYNVRWFADSGSDVTYPVKDICTSITTNGGGCLFAPVGSWAIDSIVLPQYFVKVRGEAMGMDSGGSRWIPVNSSTPFLFKANGDFRNITFEHCALSVGTNTVTNALIIDTTGTTGFGIDCHHVLFHGTGSGAVNLVKTVTGGGASEIVRGSFHNCQWIQGHNSWGLYIDSRNTQFTVQDSSFLVGNGTSGGIDFYRCGWPTVINCDFRGPAGAVTVTPPVTAMATLTGTMSSSVNPTILTLTSGAFTESMLGQYVARSGIAGYIIEITSNTTAVISAACTISFTAQSVTLTQFATSSTRGGTCIQVGDISAAFIEGCQEEGFNYFLNVIGVGLDRPTNVTACQFQARVKVEGSASIYLNGNKRPSNTLVDTAGSGAVIFSTDTVLAETCEGVTLNKSNDWSNLRAGGAVLRQNVGNRAGHLQQEFGFPLRVLDRSAGNYSTPLIDALTTFDSSGNSQVLLRLGVAQSVATGNPFKYGWTWQRNSDVGYLEMRGTQSYPYNCYTSDVAIGYAHTARQKVTQITSRSNQVSFNAYNGGWGVIHGQVTTHNASLAPGGVAVFEVLNGMVFEGDRVTPTIVSGSTTERCTVHTITTVDGAFKLLVINHSATTAETGALVIIWDMWKGGGHAQYSY